MSISESFLFAREDYDYEEEPVDELASAGMHVATADDDEDEDDAPVVPDENEEADPIVLVVDEEEEAKEDDDETEDGLAVLEKMEREIRETERPTLAGDGIEIEED